MKRWLKITVGSAVLCLSTSATIFAASDIKLVVSGQTIPTDVAPKIDHGRVMVPISTVSKALGAQVQWDSKNQTVFVTPVTDIGQTEVWDDELNIPKSQWVDVRNLVTKFIIDYDTRDTAGKELVTKDFTSDFVAPEVVIPIGGQTESFIDYKIVDATTLGTDHYKVRAAIVKQEANDVSTNAVTRQYLDFEVVFDKDFGGFLIKSITKAGEEALKDYSPVPGLTYKTDK